MHAAAIPDSDTQPVATGKMRRLEVARRTSHALGTREGEHELYACPWLMLPSVVAACWLATCLEGRCPDPRTPERLHRPLDIELQKVQLEVSRRGTCGQQAALR